MLKTKDLSCFFFTYKLIMQTIGFYLTVIVVLVIYILVSSKIYFDYLQKPNKKSEFKLFLIPGLVFALYILVMIYEIVLKSPFVYLLPAIFIFWLLLAALPNLYFSYQLNKKKLYTDKICGTEVTVADFEEVNAFTDLRDRKIYVTNTLLKLLNSEEICAVIGHEKGHIANRFLGFFANGMQIILSISTIALLVLLIFLSLLKPLIELIDIIFGVYVILFMLTLIVTMWYWLNEHEADLNSKQKEALISALIKMILYNNLQRYIKISPENFNKLNLSDFGPKDVKFKDIIREIALPKFTIRIPIRHPPPLFRIFLLKNANKA